MRTDQLMMFNHIFPAYEKRPSTISNAANSTALKNKENNSLQDPPQTNEIALIDFVEHLKVFLEASQLLRYYPEKQELATLLISFIQEEIIKLTSSPAAKS